MTVANLLEQIPAQLPSELFEPLLSASNVRIERIVSLGHSSPQNFWYDQAEGEWILLLRGAARLLVSDDAVDLRPGDCLNLPAHTRHRVEWTTPDEPSVWLAVFYQDRPTNQDRSA